MLPQARVSPPRPKVPNGAAAHGPFGSVDREGLPIRDAGLRAPEAHALIEREGSGRVLRIDAEGGLRHAALAEGLEGSGDERRREPASAPRPPDAHMVEPSAGHAEGDV